MKRFNILMLSFSLFLVTGSFATALGDPIGDWIGNAPIDAKVRSELVTSWNDVSSSTPLEQFERFGQLAALLDKRIGYFAGLKLEKWPAIDLKTVDADLGSYPPGVQDNLRLWVARKLVHASLFDEAALQLDEKKINDDAVFDKMSLYFYRAVSAYRQMDKANTAKWVKKLNEYEKSEGLSLPERYKVVARLMDEDLSGLKKDSLDYIARQMEDIERRLDMGRSDKDVQGREQKVIDALTLLIKKMEEQQQQGSSSTLQPTQAAKQTKLMGGKGPGEVDPTNMRSDGTGWGNLPEKQRTKVMNDLGRRFPARYREIGEEYFRRMAGGGEK